MGLDDFMDLGVESSESSKTTTSEDDESPLEQHENWQKDQNGDWQRFGPYGYESQEDWERTIEGKLDTHGDLFKYNLPIFPHIEDNSSGKKQSRWHEEGNRYSMQGVTHTVSCISTEEIKLGTIPREVIMLDTGEVEKEKCLDVLEDRLGYRPEPSAVVRLHFFSKTRQLVKMAIADSMTEDWSVFMKREVQEAVFDEQSTVPFRQKDSGPREVKGVDQIEPW